MATSVVIVFLVFSAVGLISYSIIPNIINRSVVMTQKREKAIADKMERLMPRSEIKKKTRMLLFSPIILGAAFYMLFPETLQFFGVIFGLTIGLLVPGIYAKVLASKTKKKFDDQLIDALMIMSSSFRGGLSLVQALEAVVEEMPNPINYEFGTVLGENKMGVSLEEALEHLYHRMPSNGLQQMITAILLARETGGNLPVVFTRIVNTIRETKKIQQNIDTLTIQGKIQAVVMSLLPVAFAVIVYSSNRQYADIMMNSDMGRMMLMYSLISETIGVIMIIKISAIKDF